MRPGFEAFCWREGPHYGNRRRRQRFAQIAAEGMRKTYFSWDQHLNPTGNKITAEAIVAGWKDLPK